MPLTVLLPIVVIGIGGIALLLHLMGKSRRLRLTDNGQVAEIWHNQYPNSVITGVHFASGGHHALLETDEGVGLVWSMGVRAACREIPGTAGVKTKGSALIVQPGDYSAPQIKVPLDSEAEAERWMKIIKGDHT